jgi:putative ABC transport system permease protein
MGRDKSVDWVGPDYFRAMNIPLLRGRVFGPGDVAGSPKVAVVNESFARRLWPSQDPLGRRFGCAALTRSISRARTDTVEVVGVVRDARYIRIKETEPTLRFYIPLAQYPDHHVAGETLVLRSEGPAGAIVPSLRREVASLDAALAPPEIRVWTDIAYKQLMPQELGALLLVLFGGAALGLVAVGLYGLSAYVVSQRTAEIGVRLAIGASRGEILRLVLRQGLLLVALGLAGGLLLSHWTARALDRFLLGMSSSADTMAAAVAVLVLGAGGALACFIPAFRAMRMNPVEALRHE